MIYLLEPHVCEYILVVESALFCEGLQTIDEVGLQKEMPNLLDTDFIEDSSGALLKSKSIPKAKSIQHHHQESGEEEEDEQQSTTRNTERPEL